ncbi:MAG: T9SS type A sorting domain-containing protein [Bacteroidota bacterium]
MGTVMRSKGMRTNLTIVLSGVFLLISGLVMAQVPQGNRILAWQVDHAEDGDFDAAYQIALSTCMESTHLFFTWSSLEPDTGNYNAATIQGYLDIINAYYPAYGSKADLQFAIINTVAKEMPSELEELPLNHPIVISRLKTALDTIFNHIPDLELNSLNIGNESDIFFGDSPEQYQQLGALLDSVAPYAQEKYFALHQEPLKIGTTFTLEGLTHEPTATPCALVNNTRDLITTTYYPLTNGFEMASPDVVFEDFDALTTQYQEVEIHFAECGYSTSELCNSNEQQQADFYSNVFTAWDNHIDQIKYISFFKTTDWGQAQIEEFIDYYNIIDPAFAAYLGTLGVRTWEGSSSPKMAWDRIICELESRDWCNQPCVVNVEENTGLHSKLFPNPAQNNFTIELMDAEPTNIIVRDASGRIQANIQTKGSYSTTLSCNDWAPGMYFVTVLKDTKVDQLSLVVN